MRLVEEPALVDREGRIRELGAILGGMGQAARADAALAQARGLLDAAEAWRGQTARDG